MSYCVLCDFHVLFLCLSLQSLKMGKNGKHGQGPPSICTSICWLFLLRPSQLSSSKPKFNIIHPSTCENEIEIEKKGRVIQVKWDDARPFSVYLLLKSEKCLLFSQEKDLLQDKQTEKTTCKLETNLATFFFSLSSTVRQYEQLLLNLSYMYFLSLSLSLFWMNEKKRNK